MRKDLDGREKKNLEQRIDSIFCVASDLESESERARYLDRTCGQDLDLRQRVEKLLGAHDSAGDFMREPDPEVADGAGAEQPGSRIGPYKLLQVIGEGGMGTVYMAEQTDPVKRRVALKIIKPGMDTNEVIARFEAERQALALMEHPNVAKVLDAGATESGRPYFVMELVRGVRITTYCDEHRLDLAQRLELFTPVCHAVHHAHQKGIIHRDLKPANILIAEYDHEVVPKIIDFGVAKAIAQSLTEKTLFTQFGQIVGTLEYMSPEQAKLNQLDIDTRSDIYSLGVLLYELLTGTTPFAKERLRTAGFAEMLRIIREEEPPKPSTRLSTLGQTAITVSTSRRSDLQKLSRLMRHELDWIVMRALDKERSRRYESASALAADLERYLHGEAVLACPPSAAYRMRKFARRHRGPVLAAVVLLVALLIGLAGTSFGLSKVVDARNAERHTNFRMALDRGLALCGEGHVAHGMLWLTRSLDLCPSDDLAHRRLILANLNAWRRELQALQAVVPHDEPVIGAAFGPRGELLATASNDDTAQIWDLKSCRPIGKPLQLSGDGHEVVFSSDGSLLLSSDYGSTAFLWNVETGELVHKFQLRAGLVPGAAFRPPHDRQVITSDGSGDVRIWDVETGREVGALENQGDLVHDVAVSADGTRILTACHDKNVRLWNFDSRRLLAVLQHGARVPTADFGGANDELVVTGDAAGNVYIWNLAKAVSEAKGVVTLSVGAGDFVHTECRHSGGIHRLRVGPHGKRAVSASFDGTARIWDLETRAAVGPPFEHEAPVETAVFNREGSLVVTACDDGAARVWRPAVGQSVRIVEHPTSGDQVAVYTPNGLYVVAKADKKTMVVRDTATAEPVCRFAHGGGIWSATAQPDGLRLLVSGADQKGWLIDMATGEPVIPPIEHNSLVLPSDLSQDGRYTLTGDFSGVVQIRDARDGSRLPGLKMSCRVWSVRFSGDGARFAVGGTDRLLRLFDTATGTQQLCLAGHLSTVAAVAFSRDGKWIVTGSHDNTARVWDAATGKPVSDPMPLGGPVWYPAAVGFSPDGRAVVTGERVAQIWDVATAKAIGPALRHEAGIRMVAFTSDTEVRTGTSTGTVRIWNPTIAPLEDDLERIKLWVQVRTGLELDADNKLRGFDAETWNRRRARLEELGGAPRVR